MGKKNMIRDREKRQVIYYTRVKRVTNDLDAELESTRHIRQPLSAYTRSWETTTFYLIMRYWEPLLCSQSSELE